MYSWVGAHVWLKRMEASSKILTNMGLILATIGEHETAVETFIQATVLDPYLAVASVAFISSSSLALSSYRYFQCGVSNFLLERFELALNNFEEASQYLRGNQDM
jgi:neutrophil factor 2